MRGRTVKELLLGAVPLAAGEARQGGGISVRTLLVVAAACLACACGSSSEGGGGGGTGLNTAFAGTWTGTTVIDQAFRDAINPSRETTEIGVPYGDPPQRMVVVVNGNSMTVADICPGGSGHWSDPTGTITANGSGDSATWSGSYACPGITLVGGGCSGVFTYSNVTATLNGSHLTVIATGNVALGGTAGDGYQCSGSGTVTVTFSS
jgi:hypothetical protein